jgi:hypothetical protein
MKYHYTLLLSLALGGLFSCARKERFKNEVNSSDSISLAYKTPEWMKLDSLWVPILTPVDSLLNKALQAYKSKNIIESRENMKKASALLEKQADKNKSAKPLLMKSSENLQRISRAMDEDTSDMFEMDSIFIMVCDVSRKHCWDLIGDDIWIPTEEVRSQLNSAEKHIMERDSAKAAESLQKATAMIDLQNDRFCTAEGKKPLGKAKDEIHRLYHKILKGEEIPHDVMVSTFGRIYFSLAEQHYFNVTLNQETMESKSLGKEIYHCALYLQKAITIANGKKTSEEENRWLRDARTIGIELNKGNIHDRDEVAETVKRLGSIIIKYEHEFIKKKYL